MLMRLDGSPGESSRGYDDDENCEPMCFVHHNLAKVDWEFAPG